MSASTIVWRERLPAPGRLALVQEFVNSRDLEERAEGFSTPDQIRGWLHALDLIPHDTAVDEADRLRLIALREAIRELLRANSGEMPDPAAVELLNHEIILTRLRPRFDATGRTALVPASERIDRAIGTLLAVIVEATVDNTWLRLKVCSRPTCRWVFWDASRSRGGRWCAMAICGNRAKVGDYRRRHRPARHALKSPQYP